MFKRSSPRSIAAVATVAALLAVTTRAEAHARLVSATPAANSVGAAPSQVTLQFSEALVPKFSGFDLMKADGGKIAVTTSVPAKDRKAVVGVVPGRLAPGGYRVMWRAAAADDGHRTTGSYAFTVR